MRLKYRAEDGNSVFLVAECQPMKRSVLFSEYDYSKHTRVDNFSVVDFPWVFLSLQLRKVTGSFMYGGIHTQHSLKGALSSAPFSSMQDMVRRYPSHLGRGFICTPHSFDGSIFQDEKKAIRDIVGIAFSSAEILYKKDYLNYLSLGQTETMEQISSSCYGRSGEILSYRIPQNGEYIDEKI